MCRSRAVSCGILTAVVIANLTSAVHAATLERRIEHIRQAGDAAAAFPNIPRNVAMALVIVESAGNPKAVSEKKALGLTQVMPATARDLGVYRPSLLLSEPVVALTAGLKYLSQMVSRSCGALRPALAAYYAGPGRVEKCSAHSVPLIASNYVRKVTAIEAYISSCTCSELERVCLRNALTDPQLRK